MKKQKRNKSLRNRIGFWFRTLFLLRLTAEGQVRNRLFSTAEWDARALLRGHGTDDDLADLFRNCVEAKTPAHGINTVDFIRPERAMYQIGG